MTLRLEIVSPEGRVFTDEVDMVVVPGVDGELGILPHHTPLVTALGTGELRIRRAGTSQYMLISGGFVEVRPDKVVIMAFVAAQFTGMEGKYVKLDDSIKGFAEICDGKWDHLPEQAFYLVGTIEEAAEKAEKMAASV